MYIFTNKEFEELYDSIRNKNFAEQIFIIQKISLKKSEQNAKIRKRVNEMRKTNKYYGRSKPKRR